MAGKGKPKGGDSGPRIQNRRATHDYFITAKIECGVALLGSEVKSLRDGKAQLQDSYARIENGELFLHGAHIDPYSKAALAYNHDPRRPRKLLAHRREIAKLFASVSAKSTTLVPLAMYFVRGKVKLEIGVGQGKQAHDKRQDLKARSADREMRRAMTRKVI